MDETHEEMFRCTIAGHPSKMKKLLQQGEINFDTFQIDDIYEEYRGDTLLHIAVKRKDIRVIRLFLDYGADVNCKSKFGMSVLIWACRDGSLDIVDLLCKFGADLTIPSEEGYTSLIFECVKGSDSFKKSPEVGKILLKHAIHMNDRINAAEYREYYQFCKYIVKDNLTSVKKMAAYVKDVDFSNIKAETPLHYAVVLNRLEIAKFLLKRGANPNKNESLERQNVLFDAIEKNHFRMFKLLLQKNVDLNCEYHRLELPLNLIIKLKRYIMLKIILQKGAQVEKNNRLRYGALHLAIEKECPASILKALFQYSNNINVVDTFQRTPLAMIAARCKSYAEEDVFKLLQVLLDKGANPDIKNNSGQTPLMLICLLGNKDCTKLLLESKADPYLVNEVANKETALFYAMENTSTSGPLRYLIEQNLYDINSKDDRGSTILGCTKTCENFNLILNNGGDINIADKSGRTPSFRHVCTQELLQRLCCPVLMTFQKLECLGYKINQGTYETFPESFKNDSDLLKRANNYLFKKELDKTKNIVINYFPKITLYDYFFMKRNPMARFSINKSFDKFYEEHERDFEYKFPHFGSILNFRCRTAIRRHKLMDSAKKSLTLIFDNVLPEICVEDILQHFGNMELNKFNSYDFEAIIKEVDEAAKQ